MIASINPLLSGGQCVGPPLDIMSQNGGRKRSPHNTRKWRHSCFLIAASLTFFNCTGHAIIFGHCFFTRLRMTCIWLYFYKIYCVILTTSFLISMASDRCVMGFSWHRVNLYGVRRCYIFTTSSLSMAVQLLKGLSRVPFLPPRTSSTLRSLAT